jgi:hypothetical protein
MEIEVGEFFGREVDLCARLSAPTAPLPGGSASSGRR